MHPDFHILLVDDSLADVKIIERALLEAKVEHRLTAIHDGRRALDYLRRLGDPSTPLEREPDLILLDLNLPGIDGLECFQKLREMFPSLQAIVLTGFASIESARQAVHLDVVEFLTKPAHLGEIEQALDRAMKRLMSKAVEVTPAEPLPKPSATPDQTLEELERDHILSVLEKNEGNRTAAATALGISRRTLYYKLEEYQRQGYQID